MNSKIFAILSIIALTSIGIFSNSPAFGHFDHLPHNNGGGGDLGRYYVNQALEPDYAKPGEPAYIEFSIQDDNGNDVNDVLTAVEIYDANTYQRIEFFPWTLHSIGDFEIDYTFEKIGNYFVVISLADENTSPEHIMPPRRIITSTLDCDCQRALFNISITPDIGTVWNLVMLIAIGLPLAVFGFGLAIHYLNLRKKGRHPDKPEMAKYFVMFLAIAGGIVHLGVFADHGSLRIAYSVFLLAAAATQVAFGTFYVLMTVIQPIKTSRQSILSHYNKTVLLNIIGFVGTAVLLGLYVYVLIFPPPLSPNGQPEEIGIDGIFAKSIEIATMIGIIYLMQYEKKKKRTLLDNINTQIK